MKKTKNKTLVLLLLMKRKLILSTNSGKTLEKTSNSA